MDEQRLRTIVVPLPGAGPMECALPCAQILAAAGRARLVLVHSLPRPRLPAADTELRSAALAAAYLERVAARLAAPAGVQTAVFVGDAAGAIVEATFRYQADLVVLARGAFSHVLLERCPVPLLLVRPGDAQRRAAELAHRPRLLVPLDGSQFAEAALPIAASLAQLLAGRLILFQSVPPPAPPPVSGMLPAYFDAPACQAEARAYLGQLAHTLAEQFQVPLPRVDARLGPPVLVIADAIRERGVDLVVMATHAHSRLRRLLVGSVTDGILRSVQIPLVLVRPQALPVLDSSRAACVVVEPSPFRPKASGTPRFDSLEPARVSSELVP
jgi:nucleotide-binding universal stress UspA family protein